MKKILVAPTAFKGTLSPAAVASAIAAGIIRARDSHAGLNIQPVLLPLADGGDGTVESVHLATGARMRALPVVAHGRDRITAQWLDLGDRALVELASACGLARLRGNMIPLEADTRALGEVIKKTVQLGFKEIYIAVGGSASTDGGAGALSALGARFFDADRQELPVVNGGTLSRIADCDFSALEPIKSSAKFVLLTDVDNVLCGQSGAAAVFAPQKGADPADVKLLDAGLQRYASLLEKRSGRSFANHPGAGAAGGSAFGLACGLGASIQSGFGWVSSICSLKEKLAQCSLVITGEGRFDSQSVQGKVIGELIKLCTFHEKQLWVVAGQVEEGFNCPSVDRIIVPSRSQEICTQRDLSMSIQEMIIFDTNFSQPPHRIDS